MTDVAPNEHESMLEAYLDGLLDAKERTTFEQLVSKHAELRRAVEQQQRVNECLARLFNPPQNLEGSQVPGLAAATETVRRNGQADQRASADAQPADARRKWLAVAAVLAISTVAAWNVWRFIDAQPERVVVTYASTEHRSMADWYETEVEKGFEADWLCETDQEFRDTFAKQLGQPLLLARAELPRGVSWVGLSYRNSVSRNTVCLLARSFETPIIVFIDRAKRITDGFEPSGGDLKVYRRELGPLVLFEVSPLPEPRVLDQFYLPDDE